MESMKKQLLGGVSTIDALRSINAAPPRPANAPKNPPKVMICTPSGRTWEARTAVAIAGTSVFTALHGNSIALGNLESSMVTRSRNDIVQMALDVNFDYAMWIDSDMVFPPDAVLKLLAHNKDIVGATYNKRVAPYETLGKLKGDKAPADIGKGGLREADFMPGGFMLVKMDVYKKLRWPWYWETYQWPGENGLDQLKNYIRENYSAIPDETLFAGMDETPLAQWLNALHKQDAESWRYMSEDLNFCRKVRKAGYRIWCDLNITFDMIHLGTLEVTCKPPQPNPADSPVIPAQMMQQPAA